MKDFNEIKSKAVNEIVTQMLISAKTAPKGRGIESMEYKIVEKADIHDLTSKMIEIAQKEEIAFFERDAKNLDFAEAIVLIGAEYKERNLKYCQYCGFENCSKKNEKGDHPCAFTLIDLGIALGSAARTAGNYQADNRIMYTIGKAAIELKWFSPAIKIAFGIPIAIESKNPFFDRT